MRTVQIVEEIRQPGARCFKINAQKRRRRGLAVPEIRISGLWLEKLGFEPLKRVNVITGEKILIIRVDDDAMHEC